jgi:transglutaminase-like putative cysteine protease
MAAMLEGSRRVRWRWELSDRDFNRLIDLTNVLFVLAILVLLSRHGAHAVLAVFQWLPAILFLPLAAQIYSVAGRMRLSALFLSLRRAEARGHLPPSRRVDLSYPYLAVCLGSAAVSRVADPWLYPGLVLLGGWALWAHRPRSRHPALWLGLLGLAAVLGYGAQSGLRALQLTVESMVLSWFEQGGLDRTDPYRAVTAIGEIGRLKLSERILLHVHMLDGAPVLLRQASYQHYRYGQWRAGPGEFRDLPRGEAPGVWVLGAGEGGRGVVVSGFLDEGRGVLPLPGGSYRVEHLPVPVAQVNPYGALQVDQGPGFVTYTVRFGTAAGADSAPEPADLEVPPEHLPVLRRVLAEAGLPGQAPAVAAMGLTRFFQERFRYTLFQRPTLGDRPPLVRFLTDVRAGHCEYFASAGVLLLRALGIPARYAVGYAVQEPGLGRDRYMVRRRHAHAWALAYFDGAWHDVDPTPAGWLALEEEAVPWWAAGYEIYTRAAFLLARWRWSEEAGPDAHRYAWLLVPLGAVLGWRLYRRRKVARAAGQPAVQQSALSPPVDSPLYRLLGELERLGPARESGEPLRPWIDRLARIHGQALEPGLLHAAARLHYRLRFHPEGLGAEERAELARLTARWLARRTG